MCPKSSEATHVGDLTFLGLFFVEQEDFYRDDIGGLFFLRCWLWLIVVG